MLRLHLREVLLGKAVTDLEVRLLCEEAEVGQRVDLWAMVALLVESRLRKDMVHLQLIHFAQQSSLQGETCAPILSATHAGKHVKDRVEPRPEAPTCEVTRLCSESSMPESQLFNQFVERGINTVHCGQVLVDGALG